MDKSSGPDRMSLYFNIKLSVLSGPLCYVDNGRFLMIWSGLSVLRLERGGDHVIWASCTKTSISRLINKISRHMIH